MSRARQPKYIAYCTGANGTYEKFRDLDAWSEGDARNAADSRWKLAHPDEILKSVFIDCLSTAESFDSEYVSGEPLFGRGGAY